MNSIRKKIFIAISGLFMFTVMLAENTKTIDVIFYENDNYPDGSSYAVNEKHDLGNGLVIYTTLCHFTEQLRIYSSTSYNGFVVSDPLPGPVTSMSFNIGYRSDVLNVYGSIDKENWILVKGVKIDVKKDKYDDYTVLFPENTNYTCFKLDVAGENQLRIKSMSVTYISTGNENNEETEEGSGSDEDAKEEVIAVSAPTFNPGSRYFSTESLDVTITATEGCEVYYTTDGTVPSYTNAEEYVGTKDANVTINAADTPATLKAIAVNPTTGKCSNISSATYTYVAIVNDGSKTKPYTVPEIKALDGYPKKVWVKGTIYGIWDSDKDKVITSGFTHSYNIVIGDATTYIPIKLTESSIRNLINLHSHPYLLGKEILIYGDIDTYNSAQKSIINPTKHEITYDVTINSYGCSSLYLDMPVMLPTGSTAYYCTTIDTIADLHDVGRIIPDSTGVIIYSTPNSSCTLTYTTSTNSDEAYINNQNQLFGFTKDSVIVADGSSYYALNVNKETGEVGFYIPQTATGDASSGFTAKANKAYLRVSDGTKIKAFALPRKNEETDIVIVRQMTDDTIYDLQGRSISYPTSGVYIQGGKKIIVR